MKGKEISHPHHETIYKQNQKWASGWGAHHPELLNKKSKFFWVCRHVLIDMDYGCQSLVSGLLFLGQLRQSMYPLGRILGSSEGPSWKAQLYIWLKRQCWRMLSLKLKCPGLSKLSMFSGRHTQKVLPLIKNLFCTVFSSRMYIWP